MDSSGNFTAESITATTIDTLNLNCSDLDANTISINGSQIIGQSKQMVVNEINSKTININGSQFVDANKKINAKSIICATVDTSQVTINGKSMIDDKKNLTANNIVANALSINGISLYSNIINLLMRNGMKKFVGENFAGIDFSGNDLENSTFVQTNLSESILDYVLLNGSNLNMANLTEASLNNTSLTLSTLIGANLSLAKLTCTILTNANLKNSIMHNTVYYNTIFSDTIITNTVLSDNESLTKTNNWHQTCNTITGQQNSGSSGKIIAISNDGNIVAIGAPSETSTLNVQGGSVKIFQIDISTMTWKQLGNTIYGTQLSGQTGFSIALSNDGLTLAVGSINTGVSNTSGDVKIFRYNQITSVWNQLGQTITGSVGELVGFSLAMSGIGHLVAIGNIQNTNNLKGMVKVFAYNSVGETWQQLGDTVTGVVAYDQLGYSIAMNNTGTIIAVGSTYGGASFLNGYVKILEYDTSGQTWTQLGDTIIGEQEGEQAGKSISLNEDGKIIAIGANYHDYGDMFTTHSGSVRIFNYDQSGNQWQKIGHTLFGIQHGEQFGYSVSLNNDGNRVAVGAIGNTNVNGPSGVVKIFQYNEQSTYWDQLGSSINGSQASDSMGQSVSMNSDGNVVAVSAIMGGNSHQGHVKIYTFEQFGSGTLN